MTGPTVPTRRRILSTGIASLAVATILAASSVAVAGVLEDQLAATKQESKEIQSEITQVDAKQQRIVTAISTLNERIAALDAPIAELDQQIRDLESQIVERKKRIAELRQQYAAQARSIVRLNRELANAQAQLEARLVDVYVQGDTTTVELLLQSESISDFNDRSDALADILDLDNEILTTIETTERTVRAKRARNQERRQAMQDDIKTLATEEQSVQLKRDDLATKRASVAALKQDRDAALSRLQTREKELNNEFDQLQEDAKILQEAIDNGGIIFSSNGGGSLSSSGLVWPVNGPVVSGFGWRWGRMHEGIDIAVPAGTPIHAAATGIVTYAGWMSGYGNLVLVQHAGGLVTAYAHQSQIASAVGQAVTQGQVIGFIGCTGHCYGDHLHFETRQGSTAVDPMQYL